MSSKSQSRHPFPPSMLPLGPRMLEFVSKYWRLNRCAVSPDTDKLVEALRRQMPCASVIEAASGTECLTWVVPQRWRVRHAYLKRKNGRVLADFSRNPLVLWKHSVAYKGEVERDELMRHVESDPGRPEEVFFRYANGFKHGAREWGFSLPHGLVESMADPKYMVDIDADLDDAGTLKVLNAFLPGRRKDTIFFCAHTCHPAQVSDGIANVAVLMELYRHLAGLKGRNFSYRFIFAPEFFGAAAYLAKSPPAEIKALRYGLYCDTLSSHEPIGFQSTFGGDTKMDAALGNVVGTHAETFIERGFRQLWGNDEAFYEGPGYRIPTAGLGRGMHREYHYDSDNLDAADGYHMVEALWILRRLVEVFETDFVPAAKFKGPVYMSRYGMETSRLKDKESIQIMIDGERSALDVAHRLGLDFFFVRDFLLQMKGKGLIGSKPAGAALARIP